MTTQTINEQTKFVLNGKRCEVLNLYRADNDMRYREFTDDEDPYSFFTKLMKLSELQKLLQSGEAKIEDVRKRSNEFYLSNEQLAIMDYRLKYVLQCFKESPNAPTSLRAVEESIKVVSHMEKDKKPPCQSSIQAWVKKYRDSGRSKHALLDNFVLTTRRTMPADIEEAFNDCIADYFLVEKPRTYEYIYNKFRLRCNEILEDNKDDPAYDIKIPCQSTLINRIRVYTDEEALIAKFGKTKATQKIRKKLKAFRVSSILERCEMDGLHIHLGIVDTKDNTKFLGTIVLMCVIDVYSRALLGYSIYLTKKKAEPADLIVQCLKHAFSIKQDNRWPIVNAMPCLVTDASSAATADSWRSIQNDYNVTVIITTSSTPQEKPFVESFNNTVRRMFLKFLMGYVGREKFRGQDIKLHDKVKDLACITLDAFIKEFEFFIHEVYHKNPHSGLAGRAPIDVWNAEMNKMPALYSEDIKLASGPEKFARIAERKFITNEDGFFVDGRWYKDDGLHKWLVTSGDGQNGYAEKEVFNNVQLLYSDLDVRTITAIHPKTQAMHSIPLWNKDKVQIDMSEPLQREVYLAILERPYENIDKAQKQHYEPSKSTIQLGQAVLAKKKAIKNAGKPNAEDKPQHLQVDSQDYRGKLEQHVKDNTPDNVIINKDSRSVDDSHVDNDDWENDVAVEDVGGTDDEL